MAKRDKDFGRFLGIANILGERVFEEERRSVSALYQEKLKKNPAKAVQLIHENLMQYQNSFTDNDWVLMDILGDIIADMDEEDFTNEGIEDKEQFILQSHRQRGLLSNLMSSKHASEYWGISEGYIKNLCAEGKIDAVKIGKSWVIDKRQENPSAPKD
ncbi:helix-turn-helix domain-containing protein [Oceanobacillus jeddahense]|uniref:helix-turn-helix domain-containing protein n=1 Tax=Oceanobacillus jeddahense TaxID=1462527 RepID=UPI000595CBBD|nr:helix-turn-helix domain-containing protein [Oceanobacillus jeddahense]